MEMIQLEFFRTEEEIRMELLQKEMKEVKKSADKVRKGCFAKIGELKKQCDQIQHEFDCWKKALCLGELTWKCFEEKKENQNEKPVVQGGSVADRPKF